MRKSVHFLVVFSLLSIFSTASADGCKKTQDTKPSFTAESKITENLEVANYFLRNADKDATVASGLKAIHKDDKRKAISSTSPAFLDAVGRLVITRASGKKSICSGSLIADENNSKSKVVITAAHCFKTFKEKVTWETVNRAGEHIKLNAKLVDIDHAGDNAIVILEQHISNTKVQPLHIDFEYESQITDVAYLYDTQVYVAGYSADKEIGKNGGVLTYEESEFLIDGNEYNEKDFSFDDDLAGFTTVNAFTYGGASGGAIIGYLDLDENGNPKPYLFGIIRGGNAGVKQHVSGNGVEGSNDTRFYNTANMLDRIKDALEIYNN
jgi:V8-like Glu-specific endopeptidase